MADKHISHIIDEVCQKEGIQYKSCNPNYIHFNTDAQLLGQLYKDLLDITDKLHDIADRHDVPELKDLLHDDIDSLLRIDHDLIKLASKLREEK